MSHRYWFVGTGKSPFWSINSGKDYWAPRASLREQRILTMTNRWTVRGKRPPRWAEVRQRKMEILSLYLLSKRWNDGNDV